jgi:hypothetical protein
LRWTFRKMIFSMRRSLTRSGLESRLCEIARDWQFCSILDLAAVDSSSTYPNWKQPHNTNIQLLKLSGLSFDHQTRANNLISRRHEIECESLRSDDSWDRDIQQNKFSKAGSSSISSISLRISARNVRFRRSRLICSVTFSRAWAGLWWINLSRMKKAI